ncbi:uncharacterized protein BXZ73DRAFT_102756 [Epithele typhae]|uniref:uncharacterized protein n=1 Tax=Epithele typhae TaxID=378194 RepID=UPI002008D54B|nr:uncharacterized protein BXZ73DRAFT_102756 [Epithele typhae]KAH9927168.1 hypothetical protein BXZ73DRAFT_102756 [Epithele typhae]
MRGSSASPARALTLLFLALFISQSFLTVNADLLSDLGNDPNPTDPTTTSTTTLSTTTTSSASHTTTSTFVPLTTSSSTQERTSTTKVSSSTETSTSTSTSSSTSLTQTSSSSTSSSTSTSFVFVYFLVSSPVFLSKSTSLTPFIAATTRTTSSLTKAPSTSFYWSTTSSESPTGTAAAGVGASSKGFFSNTPAVAATFSVAGIVALGAVIFGVVLHKRRAARLQDEEDMTYFEKYNPNGAPTPNSASGNASENGGTRSPTAMSFNGGPDPDNLNELPATTAAATDAYPDRAMHYGNGYHYDYAHHQAPAAAATMDYARDRYGSHAVDYPPAAAAGYDITQYPGYEGYVNQEYIPRVQSPNHPFADPSNMTRVAGAPQVTVTQHFHNADNHAYHGEAR